MHQFSIVTPTFNRSKYLPRIYDCLSQQGDIDFEWIIVDDGSTDNTKNIVASFNKSFKINYIYQKNGGQLSARNTGTKYSNSYILAKLDDDDLVLPNVLQNVWSYFNLETLKFKDDCACLAGLCQDDFGKIIGDKFPKDYFISDHIRCRQNIPIRGDKYEFYVTNIFKKYPFPVIEGEKNMPPHIVHDRMAREHKTLYLNQVFAEKNFFQGGLSSQNYVNKYTFGSELYYNEASMPPFKLKLKIHHSSRYIYYAKKNKKNNIYKNAKNKKIYPLGLCRYYLILLKIFLEKYKFFNFFYYKFLNENTNIKNYKQY